MAEQSRATSATSAPPRRSEGVALLFFIAAFPWVLGAMILIRLQSGARPEEDAAMLPPADLRLALQLVLAINVAALLIGGCALVWRFFSQRAAQGSWLRLLLGLVANGLTVAAGLYVWGHYLNHQG